MKTIGYDMSLTHGSFVLYDSETNTFEKLFAYDRKSDKVLDYVIEYTKDDETAIRYKMARIVNELVKSINYRPISGIAIDFDVNVFFNTSRVQAIYTGIMLGHFSQAITNLDTYVMWYMWVKPSDVRKAVNLPPKTKKIDVQAAYQAMPNFPLIPETYSEDDIDAAILAWYINVNDV